MQRRAVVDAARVPVAVLLEEEVDRLVLPAHVRIEQGEADRVALRHCLAVPPRARHQPAVAIEEAPQQVHPAECCGGEHVGLCTEFDHFFGGGWRMIRQRCVQRIGPRQVEARSVLQKQVHQRPGYAHVAGLLTGDQQSNRVPPVRTQRSSVHVGTGVQ